MQTQTSPRLLSRAELAASLSIIGGEVAAAGTPVFGIFRNEMPFVAAFFAHYRSLGASQFLILDDHSDDGTREYLLAQPDCVVLHSSLRFGQKVIITDGAGKQERAGTLLKSAIPKRYLAGRWALYVDADEFLLLPPGIDDVQTVIAFLARRGQRSVVASLVDFYPLDISGYDQPSRTLTLADLLAESPYFDAGRLLVVPPDGQPRRVGIGASMRLFERFGIEEPGNGGAAALPPRTPKAAWLKTPLLKWDDDVWMEGSHEANILPPRDLILTIAHFKFGPDILRRIASAIAWKSHANNSSKYHHYDRLIQRMRASGQGFIGRETKRFAGSEDLVAAGLMVVPAELRPEPRT